MFFLQRVPLLWFPRINIYRLGYGRAVFLHSIPPYMRLANNESIYAVSSGDAGEDLYTNLVVEFLAVSVCRHMAC